MALKKHRGNVNKGNSKAKKRKESLKQINRWKMIHRVTKIICQKMATKLGSFPTVMTMEIVVAPMATSRKITQFLREKQTHQRERDFSYFLTSPIDSWKCTGAKFTTVKRLKRIFLKIFKTLFTFEGKIYDVRSKNIADEEWVVNQKNS